MAEKPKKKSNIVVWAVLGLLVLALGGFGIGNFGGTVRSIGSVGDVEIPVQEYYLALQTELRAQQAETGQPVPLASPTGQRISERVRRQLIGGAALEQETRRLGISVGDEAVRQQVVATPAFRGLDGTFDRAAYAEVIRRSGLTESDFEENIRADAATGLVSAAVLAGVEPPVTQVEALAAFAGERRDVLWLILDAGALEGETPAPTEAELQAAYEANLAAYTRPERKQITYVVLTPEALIDEVTVDEAEIRALYDERAAEYNLPERRLVERLVFPDAAAAEAAKVALGSGSTSFDALVADRGLSLIDVDLGDVSEAQLGAAGAAVFALEAMGVAGPVETSLGPALFRVNAVLPAQETPFEEVREDLREELARGRARAQVDALRGEIEDLLAAGNTLEDVAGATAMELGSIEVAPDTADGVAAYAAFRDAAEAVTSDSFPQLFQLEDGGLAALRLDATLEPALMPLDEVRDRVTADWERAETQARLVDLAEELKAARAAGESWEVLGQSPTARDGIGRDSFLDGAPDGLVAEAFGLAEGGIAVASAPDGRVHLLEVAAVMPEDPQTPDAQAARTAFGGAAAQGIAQDMLNGFITALENAGGVTVNQAAINAVHGQFP